MNRMGPGGILPGSKDDMAGKKLMKVHFLKTKWSDIIILEKNGKVALVDTGFDEQYEQINEYLERMEINKIEFILLTHFHRDHYGCIPKLLENYKVGKVYFKEYSGLDITTAWGAPADDAYRNSEKEKCRDLMKLICEKSSLVSLEGMKELSFEGTILKLYNTENSIKEIYEDALVPETFGKICFTENQNSLAVFFEEDGKKVFLGGDMMDLPSAHPKANYVNLQTAQKIACNIDLYKVPHHATVHTGIIETLNIYKPKIAVITNEDAYLKECSDAYDNLMKANPSVKIVLTEKEDVVIDLENDLL